MITRPFSSITAACSAFLNGEAGTPSSTFAGAFFNPPDQAPIPIYTENKATVEQTIHQALMKTGISVYIGTAQGKAGRVGLRNRDTGAKEVYFDDILLYVYSLENPKVNPIGVDYDQCQAAISYYLPEFNGGLSDGIIELKDSSLAVPPLFKDIEQTALRSYLTLFSLSGSVVLGRPTREND